MLRYSSHWRRSVIGKALFIRILERCSITYKDKRTRWKPRTPKANAMAPRIVPVTSSRPRRKQSGWCVHVLVPRSDQSSLAFKEWLSAQDSARRQPVEAKSWGPFQDQFSQIASDCVALLETMTRKPIRQVESAEFRPFTQNCIAIEGVDGVKPCPPADKLYTIEGWHKCD